MALRGKKPEAVQKRFKAFMFGAPGVGKTTAAIQFPKPYLIDTERGAENDQYRRLLEASGGVIYQTSDFDDMLREVTELLTTKHDFQTLVIDPLSVPYAELCDKSAKQLAAASKDPNSDGMEFGRHKGRADAKVKHLLNLLLRLDMNVIITSHAKDKWVGSGNDRKPDGQTFDCYAKLDYLFDLVIEIQKRGKERVGVVKKTRIESFPEGDTFSFTYGEVASRYGKDNLEKITVPEVLATAEQIAELQDLLSARKDGEDLKEKWLEKAKAETLSELPSEAAAKCIDFLKSGAAKPGKAE